MSEFPAVISLGSLNGSDGFRLDGAATYDQSGRSVASAGDVNGDGFDDVIVGARGADANGVDAGASYVVFGKAGGFAPSLALSSLTGTNGFRIAGAAIRNYSGFSVASAGDVNGDGFDDVVVGARRADSNGIQATGASYVVFGKAGGFGGSLSLAGLDETNGFRIDGVASLDYSGHSVASAGDINGDGFDDLIVGAVGADPNGASSGSSYVVFGKAGGFASSLQASSLDGTNGFRIDGAADADASGVSVASAGDVNDDGFDDLIIGASGADPNGSSSGSSYVVFGKAGGFAANLSLADLNGANGFRIDGVAPGDRSGFSVSSAGDVNGDGFDDLIVGAQGADPSGSFSGSSYVVFGKAGGFGASLQLLSLNGSDGFRLDGASSYDRSGRSVASAGDVNGDGFGDLIVGAYGADPNGSSSGSSYVVFGKAGGFAASLSLADLNGANGFRLDGTAEFDYAGYSASAAGDVNGDGFDDLIVGANFADPNGYSSGSSYVVFGRAPDAAVNRTGTSVANTIRGGAFNDTLSGLGGDDYLIGGGGADIIDGGTGGDFMDGGTGNDVYYVDNVADFVAEAAGGGTDRILTRVSFALGAASAVETLAANNVGSTAVRLTGNDLANSLIGGAGADTLIGGGGNDRLSGGTGIDAMSGGLGNDTYILDNVRDVVTEAANAGTDTVQASLTYTLAANVENLILTGTAAINGTGNTLANRLSGNGAANTLNGGTGADTLIGGLGNDVYVVDNAGDVVIEAAGAGTDTVQASVTHTLRANVETLILTGTAAINGTGNDLANTLTGNGAANTLDGGTGNDRMSGGLGNDTYLVDSASDLVIEAAGAGTDTVRAGVTYTLTANVEALVLTGADAINGTGNTLANSLTGNGAANTLDGGTGNDTLRGGAGNDTFRFSTALSASTNLDHIADFTRGDRIALDDAVFTALSRGDPLSPAAFATITAAGDSVAASARILYDDADGALYYDADGGSAANRVQFAVLDNLATLTSGAFLVV